MLAQLDLFASMPEQEPNTSEKEPATVTRKLTPPAVIHVQQPQQAEPVTEEKNFEKEVSLEVDIPVEVDLAIEKTTVLPVNEKVAAVKTTRGRKSIREMSLETARIEVPADDILYTKQYYGIGEVAGMFQVNASLLRYWESEFDILKPRKNKKGDRFFRPDDIKNLQLIHHLLRERKYTIEGAKDFLKNSKKSARQFEAIESLKKIKSFLLEMRAGLSVSAED
jgi:DNA-binding transcriptional MerR regulator